MDRWTNEELQKTIKEVAERSSVDNEFRVLAIKDANSALSKLTSKQLPQDLTFKFVDNSGPVKTIPLPDPVAGIELSPAELEMVAGGSVSATLSVTVSDGPDIKIPSPPKN